jgi:beta-glucanase (GH16 family)
MELLRMYFILVLLFLGGSSCAQKNNPVEVPAASKGMQLVWSDDFDYPNAQLDASWIAQNGPSTHILCSRWRENAVVENGLLYLKNKKENRGGQEWTSASIWTKKQFQYGRFECRYKYAAATGTNNSFWIMTTGYNPPVGKKFEIDINEGHYPAEMATNLHNWTDITTDPVTGKSTHPSSSQSFHFNTAKPDVVIQLETPVTTRRIRLTSGYGAHFHIQEFRIYKSNAAGYPTVLSPTADQDVPGLVNYARDPQTKISSSGVYGAGYEAVNAADGGLIKHWVSQVSGDKWLEFEFGSDKTIGCLQFVSGWLSGSSWNSVIDNYKVQYYKDNSWVDMAAFDASKSGMNLANEFHTYALEWSKDSLIYSFDGKVMRRIKNDICQSPAPIYLSEAIIAWAGAVTDAIDGTSMVVDWVKVYQLK